MSAAPLERGFYARSVLVVARELVGKRLVRRAPEGLVAGRIVETEAYRGPDDLAAHSSRGRRTARTEAMFGEPGRAYLYFLYGMHWAFNVVCGPEGAPHAVLVRAVEPLEGAELMAARRGVAADRKELTNGPGKVAAAFGLDRARYAADLCGGSDLWIEDAPRPVAVGRSPRINVDYAGAWAQKPWRFYERGNRWVSVKPRD